MKRGKRGFERRFRSPRLLGTTRRSEVSRFRESRFLCQELSAWRGGRPLATSLSARVWPTILKKEAKQCRWLMETRDPWEEVDPSKCCVGARLALSLLPSTPPYFLRWLFLPLSLSPGLTYALHWWNDSHPQWNIRRRIREWIGSTKKNTI